MTAKRPFRWVPAADGLTSPFTSKGLSDIDLPTWEGIKPCSIHIVSLLQSETTPGAQCHPASIRIGTPFESTWHLRLFYAFPMWSSRTPGARRIASLGLYLRPEGRRFTLLKG